MIRLSLTAIRARIGAGIAGPVAAAAVMAALPSAASAQSLAADARTPGEASVGQALDAILAPGTTPYGPLRSSITALPTAGERADALASASPAAYRVVPRLAIQSMDRADAELRDYLAGRRELGLEKHDGKPLPTDRTVRLTVTTSYREARFEARTDRPAAASDSRAVRALIDVSPMPGLVVGATLGIDGTDVALDRQSRARSTQFAVHLGPYASWTDGRFYADASALYQKTEAKLRREVSWTGFSNLAQNRGVDGDGFMVGVEGGSIHRFGPVRLEPHPALRYRYADVSGFVESGGPAALAVGRFRSRSTQGTLGLRASTAVAASADWTIRPRASAEWRREFARRPESRIESTFAAGGVGLITLPATRFDRDSAVVEAGLSAERGSRTQIRLGWAGDFANDRRVHAFTLSASRRF